jgi:hypothetical protein
MSHEQARKLAALLIKVLWVTTRGTRVKLSVLSG